MTKKNRKGGMEPSPLAAHRRKGKILQPPMNQLGGIQLSSWISTVLPEMLWAALLVSSLPRKTYLETFKRMLSFVQKNKDGFDKIMLDHSGLAELDEQLFNGLFEDILSDEKVADSLTPLLLVDGLPGKERWKKFLKEPDEAEGIKIVDAVAESYDHQSEKATDIRWLRIMTENEKGKLHFAEAMVERFNDIMNYPENEDYELSGGSVRALEMSTRSNVEGQQKKPWAEEFWAECLHRSECVIGQDEDGPIVDHKLLIDVIHSVYEQLIAHYMTSMTTTDVDARLEGSFGLAFYIMHLGFLALKASVGQTVQGRLNLRTVVEALITLAFLAKKDDPTIWMQYRNYGASQAKLAFLKFDERDAPSAVTKELLEKLANADIWMEFQDIKLGAWDDKNLRKMAEEAGAKQLYDKYYDALSGYVHANWAAVSHSTFGLCVNPLHRFHRVPIPPRFFIEDAVPDLMKLINLALDQITMLYPPFKPRIRTVESEQVAESNPANG